MNATLGQGLLVLALMAAVVGAIAAIAHAVTGDERFLRVARAAGAVFAGGITGASALLLMALVNSDFQLRYVAKFTERALPMGYKLAAFWAGQEGSLLLWAWLMGVMGVAVGLRERDRFGVGPAVTTLTMLVVCGFFAGMMVFVPEARPFATDAARAVDGQGLNPLLQNVAMVAHPPTLFIGYAGFAVPFAMMLGALAGRKTDGGWVKDARPWAVFSWLGLSVGILLGSWWAYVELGWGGYWAWDPVENASLLPWLTATALLHSMTQYQKRGTFKFWTVGLTATTFLLCIVATWITRSGAIQSVHSFERSVLGWVFLGLLAAGVAASAGLIALRAGMLRGAHRLEKLLSREGTVLGGNVLLVVMMLATLAGTLFPLVSGLFLTEPVSVSGPFYNQIVLPLAMLLGALVAMGPLLRPGDAPATRAAWVAKGTAVAVGVTVAGLFGLQAWAHRAWPEMPAFQSPVAAWIRGAWVAACVEVVAAVVISVAVELVAATGRRVRELEEGWLGAAWRTIDADHRRWGGYVVHLGMAATIAGVAGSSLYNQNQTFKLREGESATLAGNAVTFRELAQSRHENYEAVTATVELGDGEKTVTLRPEQRFYFKGTQPGQSASEVDIRYGLAGDVYMNLAGWSDNGQEATIQVILNPLVSWIWVGGVLMTLGGAMCLVPRLVPATAGAEERAGKVAMG